MAPDLWLDGDADFRLGGLTFRLIYSGGGHSPEDLMLYVVEDRLPLRGRPRFRGTHSVSSATATARAGCRRPTGCWRSSPAIVIPGHGPASRDVARDLTLTHDYLVHLRATMGRAVQDLTPFDEAYAKTDWSRYRSLPAFEPANRINAWGTYLRMEQEELQAGGK